MKVRILRIFKSREIKLSSLNYKGPVLLNEFGVPVYWGNIYVQHDIAHKSSNTIEKHLNAIREFYLHSIDISPAKSLDEILNGRYYSELNKLLQSYLIKLVNDEKCSDSGERKWRRVLLFVESVLKNIGESADDYTDVNVNNLHLLKIKNNYKQLHVHSKKKIINVRAIPLNVIDYLFELLSPESPSNPFKNLKTIWNAYLSFLVFMYLGLRAGELLSLPVNALKYQYDHTLGRTRFWINVATLADADFIDPRASLPSSTKTPYSKRQVPVPEQLATLINAYVLNIRGKQKHPILFSSTKNLPLSQRGLNEYYSIIETCIPIQLKTSMINEIGHSNIEPHGLRHTSAVAILTKLINEGLSMDMAFSKMRIIFGWSKKSDMPEHYTRAYFASKSSEIWMNSQDIRIDRIREMF